MTILRTRCVVLVSLVGFCSGFVGIALSADDITQQAPAEIAPLATPFEMPALARPQFPERQFSIADYGAQSGGKANCTAAFAGAVEACSKAGGGRVLVPAGEWLTGPIHLRSRVHLHLADGAVLRFSQKFEDYLPAVLVQRGGVRCYTYSPLIYARDCTDVAVTGKGTLDGQGQVWWPWQKQQPGMKWLIGPEGGRAPLAERVFNTPEQGVRPPFIQFYGCKNVLLEGFTIKDGPSWTIHPVYCENVIARGLTIRTYGVVNGDGIDPDSCRNMLIEYCDFDNGDDCVVLKAGRDDDAWAVGKPCENIVVRHCRMGRGHGAIAVGSEMSAGVRNVFVHDCHVDGSHNGIYMKSKAGRDGVVENVWVRNVKIANVRDNAIFLNLRYEGGKPKVEHLPVFRNINIEKIECAKAARAITIDGLPGSLIQKVSFADLTLRAKAGVLCRAAEGVVFQRVKIEGVAAPVFRLDDARDVLITDSPCPAAETFLSVNGASRAIKLTGIHAHDGQPHIVRGDGVPADAVEVERQ